MTQSIGERIKSLRTKQGSTLAELGKKANVSTSYLSQIERDRTSPSLATLAVIARALNVELRHLFEDEAESAYVVRSDDVSTSVDADAAVNRPLTAPASGNKLSVASVKIESHGSSGQIPTFEGEELLFILKGRLEVTVEDERFTLAAGDSIHYDAELPHSWINNDDEPCVLIWSLVISSLEHRFPSEKEVMVGDIEPI
ncbi:MAG: helix-turn-helix domain-containing protein [Rectinemataceae bacterium]